MVEDGILFKGSVEIMKMNYCDGYCDGLTPVEAKNRFKKIF